jgi:hypothetical protein
MLQSFGTIYRAALVLVMGANTTREKATNCVQGARQRFFVVEFPWESTFVSRTIVDPFLPSAESVTLDSVIVRDPSE